MTEAPPPPEIRALESRVVADGGTPLAAYREPFGAKWLLLAALPLDKVAATPYQRELSETHAKRLATVIPKVGRFLDPVIATPADGVYWTPNGMHRLNALSRLGAKAIVALIVPEKEVAYRILALNTEKAHNLKDKSLEVIRMARGLAAEAETAKRPESDWTFEFEEPSYLTMGMCYESRPRFSGAVYLPPVRRCEEFSELAIGKSLTQREKRAERLLELDDAVADVVARLKNAGLKSPYLKPFVVARINPLRFARAPRPGQKAPRADFDATVAKMLGSAKKLDVSKVRAQDITAMGGGAPPEE